MKMPGCYVGGCKNRSEKGSRLYCSPTGKKTVGKRKKWFELIGEKELFQCATFFFIFDTSRSTWPGAYPRASIIFPRSQKRVHETLEYSRSQNGPIRLQHFVRLMTSVIALFKFLFNPANKFLSSTKKKKLCSAQQRRIQLNSKNLSVDQKQKKSSFDATKRLSRNELFRVDRTSF